MLLQLFWDEIEGANKRCLRDRNKWTLKNWDMILMNTCLYTPPLCILYMTNT